MATQIKKTTKAKPTKTQEKNKTGKTNSAANDQFQSIPLSKLKLSPSNVRKSEPSAADDQELKNSISENGLKQNLVVHSDGYGGYLVNAGGRRLKAFQELAEEGEISKDFGVRCLIEDEDEATITSTLENTHRAAMHPADQFQAFDKLIEEGRTEEEIATKFSTSVDIVRKRLKLARVAPEIFEAFRKDEINLESVMAFTLSDDLERQLGVWKIMQDGSYFHTSRIKQMLTENKYAANSKLAKFVGLENYQDAGGKVTTDLFSDHDSTYFDEPALLERLASEKLNEIAKKYTGDWKWVDAILEMDYEAFRTFGRIYPIDETPNPELEAKIKQLKSRDDELRELESERDLTDDEEKEYHGIDGEIEAIRAQIEDQFPFDEEQLKFAGVVVTLDWQGNVDINRGLVRPEDIENLKSIENNEDDDNETGFSQPTSSLTAPSSDTASIVRRSEGITQGLANDLRSTRHHILQAHLAGDYDVAFDVMLYTICSQALSHKYLSDMPLDVTVRSYYDPNQNKLVKDSISEKMLIAIKSELNLDWTQHKQPHDFHALCALSMEDKQALFAWATAHALDAQLATDDRPNMIIEEIGTRMDVSVAECWRPTAANYWGTVTKAHIGAIAEDLIGGDFARERLSEKKGEAAAAMETVFSELAASTTDLDPSVLTKTISWLPAGMAFQEPNHVDVDEASSDEASSDDLPAFLKDDQEGDKAA